MSISPLFKKLNYKDQQPIAILHAPESFVKKFDQWLYQPKGMDHLGH